MSRKLSSLLAFTEACASTYAAMKSDYIKFFTKSQGSFIGVKKTYTPAEGTVDEPNQRENKEVITTVNEKLSYFAKENSEFIQGLLDQEATNASGKAKTILRFQGQELEVSTLELLRLKNILEENNFKNMLENLPVRSDSEKWVPSEEPGYKQRGIFENTLTTGEKKTIEKESYILPDPNISQLRDTSKYQPQVSTKNTIVKLGDYTLQKFSGELSHYEKAAILQRRQQLYTAVLVALKEANDTEIVSSQLNANSILLSIFGIEK